MTSFTMTASRQFWHGLEIPEIFNRSNSATPESLEREERIMAAYGRDSIFDLEEWLLAQLFEDFEEDIDSVPPYLAFVHSVTLVQRVLDHGWFLPHVAIDSDGDVSLEWFVDHDNTMAISISPREDASIAYRLLGKPRWGVLNVIEEFDNPTVAAFREIDELRNRRLVRSQAA